MLKFIIRLVISSGIAYLAYRARALNQSGAAAAGVLGAVVFGMGGPGWAVVLLTFFITASVLSRLFGKHKQQVGQDFAKGSRRDAGQVAANGAMGGAAALAYFLVERYAPGSSLLPLLWLAFAASFAGANADTWGTELGVLNPQLPVLLKNFKRVPRGTSGAISLMGTLAALAGSALVAAAAVLVVQAGWAPIQGISAWVQFLLITGAGLVGAFVDSALGATAQAVYYCPACEKETERHPRHGCGTDTFWVRGLPWLNNDWVNAACTFSAGIVGLLLGMLFW